MDTQFIFKKEIDWSVLHQGFTIPISIQVAFQKIIKNEIPKGITKNIKILLNGNLYNAKLINQKFNESKYPKHSDIIQIRYNPQSELAIHFRKIFIEIYKYIIEAKNQNNINNSKKNQILIPEYLKQYIILYTTKISDTYLIEFISNKEQEEAKGQLSLITEDEFEYNLNFKQDDKSASIKEKLQLVKIRKLDRSICENLKQLYNYSCQMTGEKFGSLYNTELVEAHHLDYFIKSLNNNSENIIILCPNYHRLIHKTNPMFDRNKLSFIFPNGYIEKIKLNYHL